MTGTFAKLAVPVPLHPYHLAVDYRIPEALQGTLRPGHLVSIVFGRRKMWGLVFDICDQPDIDPAKVKELGELLLEDPVFDGPRLEFLRWLSKYYFYPLGEVCETAIPAVIREGSRKKLKAKDEAAPTLEIPESHKTLNAAQADAVKKILASSAGAHLLWGVTGSGKTEVYLQAIAEKHREGKGALMLVPEIALTPQLTQRFEARFPGEVAVLHSGLKPTEIRAYWLDLLRGKRRIVIGARSAIFAPLKEPGLIIVDEEHESSYKQEDRLRYHAREAALKLATLYKIPAVLGSATPSAESFYAVQSGQMELSVLPERAVASARLPDIEIVDLRKNIAQESKLPLGPTDVDSIDGGDEPTIRGDFFLSVPLREALKECLARGEQAILFLNRRGLGSQDICLDCGASPLCPDCEVSLTPHAKGLLCHYCGYNCQFPETCPTCGKNPVRHARVGVGTEAVEEVMKFHFPEVKTLRLDRDTTENHDDLEDTLDRFGRGEAQVLIGTQMVAKGHDFPRVTLVGILLADMGLTVPDFRAQERCLQTLLQVAGRAGRGETPGRVILQTFSPEHSVMDFLAHHRAFEEYKGFISQELDKRKMLSYTPFGQLALLRLDGLESSAVAESAATIGAALRRIPGAELKVLGPSPSPFAKLRGRYRWQLLLKSQDPERLRKALDWVLNGWREKNLEAKYRTRFTVDIDPVQMM